MKPFLHDTIALFLSWIKQQNAWSIWMWCDLVLFLFWFRSLTCTVRLLFHSLLERGWGWGVRLKLDVQGQDSRKILHIDGQGVEESWKLDNFHGRHMCIVPKVYLQPCHAFKMEFFCESIYKPLYVSDLCDIFFGSY